MNDLTDLANKYGSDKGNVAFEAHNYTPVYERVLGEFPPDMKLLEIGVFDPRFPGGSAHMWREWRPQIRLFGADINPSAKMLEHTTSMKIFIADQNNPIDLKNIAKETGPLDVIIDDGSHMLNHIAVSLMVLWETVAPGGVYIIEDLHCPQTQPRHSLDYVVADLSPAPRKSEWLVDDKLLVLWK